MLPGLAAQRLQVQDNVVMALFGLSIVVLLVLLMRKR